MKSMRRIALFLGLVPLLAGCSAGIGARLAMASSQVDCFVQVFRVHPDESDAEYPVVATSCYTFSTIHSEPSRR
jgi:hypothetical protein